MAQDIALRPVVDPALDDAERALLEKSADGLFPATLPLPEERDACGARNRVFGDQVVRTGTSPSSSPAVTPTDCTRNRANRPAVRGKSTSHAVCRRTGSRL
ncbi:hypothetical protein [Streptomyces sp. NPDC085479]|uniref:hypothetical protein n=1 Tax=Streptomyces sp. NPDC085479 TaxID=3365726 RepID=UPI0037D96448